jgi:DNA-binding MarR family transcriptional regulator
MLTIIEDVTNQVFLLKCLVRQKMMNEAELEEGINFLHLGILSLLLDSKRLTMKQFAHLLRITPPSATAISNKLVAAGLIQRERDQSNRRLVRISITKKGRQVYERNDIQRRKAISSILSALTVEDQQHIRRILTLLNISLQ